MCGDRIDVASMTAQLKLATAVTVLFAFVARAHDGEREVHGLSRMPSHTDRLSHRLETRSAYCSDLEKTTLAKTAGHLAYSSAQGPRVGRAACGARKQQPPSQHGYGALSSLAGRAITWPTFGQEHMVTWSNRVVAGAATDEEAANLRSATIASIDSFLDISDEDEKSDAKTVSASRAPPDKVPDRVEFRKLCERYRRQLYISSLLGLDQRFKPRDEKLPDMDMLPLPGLKLPKLPFFEGGDDDDTPLADGEITLPVMPMGFPFAPGEVTVLRLFEPRWLTLFAKLTGDESSTRMLKSIGGFKDVDLDANDTALSKAMQLYEADGSKQGEIEQMVKALSGDNAMYAMYSLLVPGHGRLDESPFIGTKRLGFSLKPASWGPSSLTTVGTVAEILGTDVKTDSNGVLTLTVVVRGVERFRATRIRQEQPYYVVDAVPLVDEVQEGQEEADARISKKLTSLLRNETQDLSPLMISLMDSMQSSEADLDEILEGPEPDPDVTVQGINAEVRNLNGLALAVMWLRNQPKAAQYLLASTNASERRVMVEKWIADGEAQDWVGSLTRLVLVFFGVKFLLDTIMPPPQM
eukprot:gnl/TRDRNA2_/TRDRNA2_158749_c0_seq1.p1 gnl/TRDRNA2_/TRDRNA2_158749_c0~~gnl/TRDRNA2_/TRDRNA2_158749_c0_seq1.p1  ORF type:complete len:581 (-),score=97.06 gnl/TRDRNA2_/TRDRNA2_158749_c0_seq1:101-1843(-)